MSLLLLRVDVRIRFTSAVNQQTYNSGVASSVLLGLRAWLRPARRMDSNGTQGSIVLAMCLPGRLSGLAFLRLEIIRDYIYAARRGRGESMIPFTGDPIITIRVATRSCVGVGGLSLWNCRRRLGHSRRCEDGNSE